MEVCDHNGNTMSLILGYLVIFSCAKIPTKRELKDKGQAMTLSAFQINILQIIKQHASHLFNSKRMEVC